MSGRQNFLIISRKSLQTCGFPCCNSTLLPALVSVGPPAQSLNQYESFPGKFWQITDIHWDLQYSRTGDKEQMCHEEYKSTNLDNGYYGNYFCDSPWPLVKSALQAMAQIDEQPDFVLWTGDNVPHVEDPSPDFSVIFPTVANITGELRTTFPESVPILPVLGNHDAFPKDDFPVAGEEFYGQYLSKGGWAALLPIHAQEDFKKGGYYAYPIQNRITMLILNTNLYYYFNELRTESNDPCGQFAWLREKFQQARKDMTKVIVSAHAPPGYFERFAVTPFFNETYNDMYVDIMNEFSDVIMAQIYGHEHTDSFKIFNMNDDGNGNKKPGSVAFLAPSVTPWHASPVWGGTAINPSVRLYSYNTEHILDYTQYHLNLTIANSGVPAVKYNPIHLQKPKWVEYYRATEAFDLMILDVASMSDYYGRMVVDDNIFQEYYQKNSAGYDEAFCDSTCKKSHICAIAHIKVDDLKACMGFDNLEKMSVDDDFHPHIMIAILAIGISLTMFLGIMVVIIISRRNRILGSHKSFVSDITRSKHQQGYRQF
ncbi:unnamed protein product, partial [Meganyctiphanes norvegica]